MRRVTPTRRSLRDIQDHIDIAERGCEVLRRRLDALVFEFVDTLDAYEPAAETLARQYDRAQSLLDRVRAMEGGPALRSVARARRDHPAVVVTTRSVVGVAVPQIEVTHAVVPLDQRGYGLLGTNPVVDEVVDAYETLLETVARVAETGATLRRLLDEIQATRCRVNALEQSILPRLREDRAFVTYRLAERERDERVRQKWLKRKRESEGS
jgi:V/A-type H+-transporting ATPase subunit D